MLYLTLRQYEYVVAVAHSGSMSAAADMVNVSQPALSVAIQSVETHLRRPLFVRKKGSPIRPTRFGCDFIVRAERVLAQAKELEDVNAAQTHAVSRLRIGCFTDLAPLWLAPMMAQVKAAMHHVEIVPFVADFETLAAQLNAGAIDLAVTYDLGLDARFQRDVLCHAAPSAFVAAGEPLAQRQRVSLEELAHEPLIMFEEGLSIRQMLALFSQQGLRPHVAHRVGSLEVMRSFAANGQGVGISYAIPPGDESYDGAKVFRVPIKDVCAQEPIVVAYLEDTKDVRPVPQILDLMNKLGQDIGKRQI